MSETPAPGQETDSADHHGAMDQPIAAPAVDDFSSLFVTSLSNQFGANRSEFPAAENFHAFSIPTTVELRRALEKFAGLPSLRKKFTDEYFDKEEKRRPWPVRIVILENAIALAAKLGSAYVETSAAVARSQGNEYAASFVLDLPLLLRLCAALADDRKIRFTYMPTKNLLEVRVDRETQPSARARPKPAGGLVLPLTTLPHAAFTDIIPRSGDTTSAKPVNVAVLIRGLRYARLFATKSGASHLKLIEVHEASVLAASPRAVGILKAPALSDIALRIGLDGVGAVERVLPRLGANAQLVETACYQEIGDGTTSVRWEKPEPSLSQLKRFLDARPDYSISASRSELQYGLNGVEIEIMHDRPQSVQLKIAAGGASATLELKVRGRTGIGRGTAEVDCYRARTGKSDDPFPEVEISVDLQMLVRVLGHFGSRNVFFRVGRQGLVIEDEDIVRGDDDGKTTFDIATYSWLPNLSAG